MWSPTGPEIILWIHILAACIWIGGQITIAALLPLLHGQPALVRSTGRRYQHIAWGAFAVLVVTGIINVHNAGISWDHLNGSAAGRTLEVKLLFVALSGLAAAVHAFVLARRARERGRSAPALSATLGIISLLTAAVAALYGVVIAQH